MNEELALLKKVTGKDEVVGEFSNYLSSKEEHERTIAENEKLRQHIVTKDKEMTVLKSALNSKEEKLQQREKKIAELEQSIKQKELEKEELSFSTFGLNKDKSILDVESSPSSSSPKTLLSRLESLTISNEILRDNQSTLENEISSRDKKIEEVSK